MPKKKKKKAHKITTTTIHNLKNQNLTAINATQNQITNPGHNRTPVARWSLHKYKYLWGVEG